MPGVPDELDLVLARPSLRSDEVDGSLLTHVSFTFVCVPQTSQGQFVGFLLVARPAEQCSVVQIV